MATSQKLSLRHRWLRAIRRRKGTATDLGQTGIIAVVAFSVLASLVGAVIVQTVVTSNPLFQAKAVEIYAHRALEAGQNAYLTAVNANPSLAQCNTNTNGSGTCSGIDYGKWNVVNGSNSSGSDLEYYSFGNPQPSFDPNTNALTSLSVQVVGAAYDPSAQNNYLFDQETINVTPSNGFLENVWWSNYESYSGNGDYSTCNYNWKLNYNIGAGGVSCGPVYFGPNDYLFGPVYTNDSVFVSPSPAFGTATAPSPVTTADPNCLFVDSGANRGMNGNHSNCAAANADVSVYDTVNSSDNHAIEQPPANDTQLGTIASQNGCLYSGPTQIHLSTDASGNGQMTVVSPDTPEGTKTVNGTTYPWDTNNIASNVNSCPNNGTAPIPPNGVVFVQNATGAQTQSWSNPFDDPTYNSVTNLTSNPAAPLPGKGVVLTATVTSGSSQLDSGATVAFKQTTKTGGVTTTSTIGTCTAQPLSTPVAVTPATTPPTYTSTATCGSGGSFTESAQGTGAFTAVYSGGNNTTSSQGNLGQTNNLSPSTSYGPDAQVTAGGCSACYYGQTSAPDAEGDAFVYGSLSGQLTIGTANNVIIEGNITYADCAWTIGQSGLSAPSQGFCPYNAVKPNDALGLIANNYVEVNRPEIAASTQGGSPIIEPFCSANPAPTCDPSDGTNGVTIDAAVLALTQSFVVNNYNDGSTEGPLLVYGSIQQFARGPIGTFSGASLSTGYLKHYTWDPLLDFISPPSYLVPSTPSWVLAGVASTSGGSAVSTCPPLAGVYQQTVGGVIQDGPALTQYCSASPGGLPNFPTMTAPSVPTNVTAVSNPNGTVTVSWTDPQANNGSAITGYSVSASPNCTSCTYTNLSGSGVTSVTVSGLTRRSWYNFTVTATNGVGTSNPSVASNAVIAPDVPNAPTNASASTNQNGSITVSWTDPANNGSPITGYTLVPSPACGSCTYSSLNGASLTSATVSGVTPGGTYSFTVTATNGVGTGAASSASNSVVAPNVPGAPTIGTATRGNASASLTWTAPGVTNGSNIIGYAVTPYLNGTTAQATQTFISTATTETATLLTNGSPYTFTVAAINGVGTGPQSGASNSVTPATSPGAPTGVSASTNSNGTVTLTWTDPSNNGSAITGYTVTPSPACPACTYSSLAGPSVTSTTITGLSLGTAYTFKVSATNGVGTGTQSTASNSVTPATPPGTPTGMTASTRNATQANVSWTAPAANGSAITGYTVTDYIAGVAQTTQSFGGTSGIFNGLSNTKSYTFTVTATNGAGTSGQSAASSPAVTG